MKWYKIVLVYFGTSFALHLIWENAQAPLFAGFKSFGQNFPICLWATITGDMVFMAVIYAVLAVVHRRVDWIAQPNSYAHPATWVLPPLLGGLIAVSFELWAVYADERWVYGSMPLIPILNVGLTPMLQMIVIPLAVIAVCKWLVNRQATHTESQSGLHPSLDNSHIQSFLHHSRTF